MCEKSGSLVDVQAQLWTFPSQEYVARNVTKIPPRDADATLSAVFYDGTLLVIKS